MTVKDETLLRGRPRKVLQLLERHGRNSKPTEKAESGMLHKASGGSCELSVILRSPYRADSGIEGGFRLQNVKVVDVELEDGDGGSDEQLTQIEKLKSKCTCTIL